MNMMKVVLEPVDGMAIKANFAICMFVMIYVDCSKHKVSRKLADVDVVVSIVFRDHNVVDHERLVAVVEALLIYCY